MFKHECTPANAAKFAECLATRGVIAVWQSANLDNPGASWSTPANAEDGTPMGKPTWQADSTPSMIITDAADVGVVTRNIVKVIRIALKRGDGLSIVLTPHSSAKVKAAVADASEKYHTMAWYDFGYNDKDERTAEICIPDSVVSLTEFLEKDIIWMSTHCEKCLNTYTQESLDGGRCLAIRPDGIMCGTMILGILPK